MWSWKYHFKVTKPRSVALRSTLGFILELFMYTVKLSHCWFGQLIEDCTITINIIAMLFCSDWLLHQATNNRTVCLPPPQSVALCLLSFAALDFFYLCSMLPRRPNRSPKLQTATRSNIIAKHFFYFVHRFHSSTLVINFLFGGIFMVFGNCEASTEWQWFSELCCPNLRNFKILSHLFKFEMSPNKDAFPLSIVTTKSRFPSTAECGAIPIEPWSLSVAVRTANKAK